MRTMCTGRGPAPVAIVLVLTVTAGPAAVEDVAAVPSADVATASASTQISRVAIASLPVFVGPLPAVARNAVVFRTILSRPDGGRVAAERRRDLPLDV